MSHSTYYALGYVFAHILPIPVLASNITIAVVMVMQWLRGDSVFCAISGVMGVFAWAIECKYPLRHGKKASFGPLALLFVGVDLWIPSAAIMAYIPLVDHPHVMLAMLTLRISEIIVPGAQFELYRSLLGAAITYGFMAWRAAWISQMFFVSGWL